MADPWLSIIGLGEDGPAGLSDASRAALEAAEVVVGGPRHLALVEAGARGMEWPVPFDPAPVLALRGRAVAVLASGDPFWHGAGGSLAAALSPGEWRAYPAPGVVALAAARLGWRQEELLAMGLHAAPFERLLPELAPGRRGVCTLRDGPAAGALAAFLAAEGWGESRLWVMEALGGPRERVRATTAGAFALADVAAPVTVAFEAEGGRALPRSAGLPDSLFTHDGQITKAPIRALTLAALAPRRGEILWDLGAGSGSISVEWCLAGGRAVAVELRPERAANIRANAARFALPLEVVEGRALDSLPALPAPDAIFVGGGFEEALFAALPPTARLVVNAVTLETEALLAALQARHGGELLRIELARAAPLGRMRGWEAARPVVQWSLVR
ncbi:precorrin-6y C5,15-methyltransferase (decarboxylating) subunit CbiE [Cereibacter sphaeroides]|uniref:precorrin-6y C5,15-methyltransferase (decarboxylating) subunit CbiE n=1 Tax=Cereibacter sphaeroides TaxID=1063 RepID=UPI00313E2DFA